MEDVGAAAEEEGGVAREEDAGGAEVDVADIALLLPLIVEVGGCG